MRHSSLDPSWVESIAFAAVHAHIADNEERFTLVATHFASAVEDTGVERILAEADVACAVARLAQRSAPLATYVLEVHEMDGGQVAPEVFQTTQAGRASVWAGRVLTAALTGDFEAVDALIHSYVAAYDEEGMQVALVQLFRGASMVVGEMYPRQQDIDHRLALAGAPLTYQATCVGRDYRGQTWDIGCEHRVFLDRKARDQHVVEHIADWGHAVSITEES